jgi:peptidoglycan-N-acetylglucosamine deacetylase
MGRAWENLSAQMSGLSIVAAGGVLAASGAFCWGAFAPASQLFGPTVRYTSDPGALALTFDDGPNPAITPGLLDLLDRHEVKATFFLIGRHVAAVPDLAKEISARGHVVGNHTQTHPNLAFCSPAEVQRELDRCDEAIRAAIGRKPLWMRPPFGFRSPMLNGIVRQSGSAGVVMWSKWAWDWKPQESSAVIGRLASLKGGDILLLHDGDHRVLRGDRQHTVDALGHWLPRWKEAGLRFVTLDALPERA